MSPLRVLRQIVRPTGQHRAAGDPSTAMFPAPPHGPAVTQAFRYCTPCRTETASVLHRDGHTCGDCGHTHYTEEGSDA